MHKLEFILRSETYRILWDFEMQTDHLIPVRRPDLRERTCCQVDFAIPATYRVKIKENKKRDLARELKKLWNLKVTVMLVIIGALGMILKGLVWRLEELKIGGQA